MAFKKTGKSPILTSIDNPSVDKKKEEDKKKSEKKTPSTAR